MTYLMSNTKKASATKTVAKSNATNSASIELGTTTYHYWRNWLKSVVNEAGVTTAKFVKTEGYNGKLTVSKAEAAKAKKAITEYQKKEQSVEMVVFKK